MDPPASPSNPQKIAADGIDMNCACNGGAVQVGPVVSDAGVIGKEGTNPTNPNFVQTDVESAGNHELHGAPLPDVEAQGINGIQDGKQEKLGFKDGIQHHLYKPLVIINPNAAHGRFQHPIKEMKIMINQVFHKPTIYLTKGPKDAETKSAEAIGSHRFEVIYVISGDGTANEVVNGIMKGLETARLNGDPWDRLPSFGIFPAGTGGDFRKVLTKSKKFKDYVKSLATFKEYTIDIGKVTMSEINTVKPRAEPLPDAALKSRYFLNESSIGYSGYVNRLVNNSSKRCIVYVRKLARAMMTMLPAVTKVELQDISEASPTKLPCMRKPSGATKLEEVDKVEAIADQQSQDSIHFPPQEGEHDDVCGDDGDDDIHKNINSIVREDTEAEDEAEGSLSDSDREKEGSESSSSQQIDRDNNDAIEDIPITGNAELGRGVTVYGDEKKDDGDQDKWVHMKTGEVFCVFACNGWYAGGGMCFANGYLDDGYLDINFVKIRSAMVLIRSMSDMYKHFFKNIGNKRYRVVQAKRARVTRLVYRPEDEGNVKVMEKRKKSNMKIKVADHLDVDGETPGGGDVLWEVVPRAINVIGEPGVIKVRSKPIGE